MKNKHLNRLNKIALDILRIQDEIKLKYVLVEELTDKLLSQAGVPDMIKCPVYIGIDLVGNQVIIQDNFADRNLAYRSAAVRRFEVVVAKAKKRKK